MTEYRVLSPAEYPQAVNLWVEVFGVEAKFFTSLLEGGSPEDNVSVAAFDGETIVSSVHVFARHIRDREGVALKVGGIGSVSTHVDHRKRRHSGQLLELAIEEMSAMGCSWTYLGTGVNNHYARYGFRTVSTRSIRGVPKATDAPMIGEKFEVNDDLLARMEPLHDFAHGARPMSHLRSRQNWRTAVTYRMTRPGNTIYGIESGDKLMCYIVAHQNSQAITLIDLAWAEGAEPLLADLMSGILNAAHRDGCPLADFDLPEACGFLPTFVSACDSHWPTEERSWMARPIADRISWPDLAALLYDPRGRRCDLDNF